METSPSARALFFFLGGLVGGALGCALTWSLLPAASAGAAQSARGESSAELAAAIRALSDELRHGRDAGGPVSAASPTETARESISTSRPAGGANERLAATLDHLAQAVQSLAATATGTRAGASPTLHTQGRTRAADAFADFDDRDNQELTRMYFGWTYQQVLDRFGVPEYTGTNGSGATWTYNVQEKESMASHTIRFVDGVVMGIDN